MSEPKSDDGEATDFRKLPVLAYYEERRTYPRVDLRIPVLLTTAAKEVFKARVRNISADGPAATPLSGEQTVRTLRALKVVGRLPV